MSHAFFAEAPLQAQADEDSISSSDRAKIAAAILDVVAFVKRLDPAQHDATQEYLLRLSLTRL